MYVWYFLLCCEAAFTRTNAALRKEHIMKLEPVAQFNDNLSSQSETTLEVLIPIDTICCKVVLVEMQCSFFAISFNVRSFSWPRPAPRALLFLVGTRVDDITNDINDVVIVRLILN